MAQTTWTPNEKQKSFMGALADGKVKSLRQISRELGVNIATGSINALITKGLVESVADGVEYTAVVVETRTYADGTQITTEKTKTDTETGYRLKAKQSGRRKGENPSTTQQVVFSNQEEEVWQTEWWKSLNKLHEVNHPDGRENNLIIEQCLLGQTESQINLLTSTSKYDIIYL